MSEKLLQKAGQVLALLIWRGPVDDRLDRASDMLVDLVDILRASGED